MGISNIPRRPAQPYTLLLHLRLLRRVALIPFSSELVQGAFFIWLLTVALDAAARLHEGQKRRFFTCSNLLFDSSLSGLLKARRKVRGTSNRQFVSTMLYC